MLLRVTRRVTFMRCGWWVGMSSAGDFNGKEVERPRSLEAEKTPRLLPHEFRPFLSKLLGKTSKLQIFPSKLRVFPSKLRRNGQKHLLILR